jgi:hypothetical protein
MTDAKGEAPRFMKLAIRSLLLLITSPIWLIGGGLTVIFALVLSAPYLMMQLVNYGFNGEWLDD